MPLRSASEETGGRAEAPAPRVISFGGAQPVAPLAARILQLQSAVLAQETFAEAAAAFATESAAMFGFERVAIGFRDRGNARVVATSHTADFQADGELFRSFAAAMDESLDQAATVSVPAAPGARPLVTLAHAQLARRYGGAACTVPLVSREKMFGALTLVRAPDEPIGAEDLALCEHVGCIVGPILELKYDAERPWYARVARNMRRISQRIATGSPALKIGLGIAAAAVLAALFLPVQYRIGAQARVEGSVQRALVAPADGYLRQVHARPGDHVKTDQVLAELAEDDLKLEQRKWQSELTQHENAAAAALARSERSQYVINQAKADEAKAQLELVESQLTRARVVAPFDGVIIKGDLSQSLGAPLKRGEVLLTIAASERFRLLVEVDERDVAGLREGQSGTVALGALSDHTLPFRVERVTPVAVTRDGRNFFEVEGALTEGAPGLRPGLQGVAKIDAGRQPLVWIWTRRFIEWARLTAFEWGL
ncbi:MAG TPA: HlyD family efflux transporter periplasmic adaptor subunit [Burkholderiales bacterium]|nr:HlyD family efflux transporter periplasmic adaptor subunit [Burkholderiales bacterium]